jgi:hypothetical protein
VPVSTWTEKHGYAGKRSKLTAWAICWAADASRHDDTTVSAIARHLGVDWHTALPLTQVRVQFRTTTSNAEQISPIISGF